MHHHVANNYRAEIDFISLDDWAAELTTIRDALKAAPEDDDTDLDSEERTAIQKSALEKFTAVYSGQSPEGLSKIVSDTELGLPQEVVQAMTAGKPLIINEDKALPLRNKVRRYLVGREQHEEAQFWPLINRVRIYGNFTALSNGVVLVDLPGLNDPNPAREHVTKKYLEEARYLWLVCNSQTGVDQVFTQVLRENGFLLRLFLEGRLDVFSIIATRIDDINLEAILEQMPNGIDSFNGNYGPVLQFRRKEIDTHVQRNLMAIAEEIASKADAREHRSSFFRQVRAIPVFSISTNAYLHAMGRMPLYQGMKLSSEETHVPQLVKYLQSVTLEQSYSAQIEASFRRLRALHEQARRFFLITIRRLEVDSDQARKEWVTFVQVANQGIRDGQEVLKKRRTSSEESLKQRCLHFEQELSDLDAQATKGLSSVFVTWHAINWRTLRAAIERRGVWFSAALNRKFDLNQDVARAYLDLVPFVWDEFFGVHLADLTEEIVNESRGELHKTAERLRGGMDMLRHQPAGIRESIEISLRTAGESFQLQTGQVRAALTAHIQRTRQALASGMVEAASTFMQPAYTEAARCPVGTGIKKRMLEIIIQHAAQHAPKLFINIRQELTEGVVTLQAAMKPQHSKILGYGDSILEQFQQNVICHQIVTPEQRGTLKTAFNHLPQPEMS
jgi:hypothetical protein